MQKIDLENKVAVVTGASSEKGRAICKALAGCGARVVIHYYKNRESAINLQDNIVQRGGSSHCVQANISNYKEVQKLFSEVMAKYGTINILVNNAHAKIIRNSFLETTWEEHQTQLDVLAKGSYFCIKESLELMQKNHDGSIINILNTQITRPIKGYSSFTTAISAMMGLTRNLAMEVGKNGVRVNMIAPGFTVTEKSEYAPAHVQENIKEQTPLHRLATPEDTANAVLFLASNLSNFITGSCLNVDGGMVML